MTCVCHCGTVLSNVVDLNDFELYVYTAKEWIEATSLDEHISEFPIPSVDYWKCPTCKRIHIFKKGERIATYKIEHLSDSELTSLGSSR
jgi:hypothetical protein